METHADRSQSFCLDPNIAKAIVVGRRSSLAASAEAFGENGPGVGPETPAGGEA